jgi:beta-phosphoglucomutase-like phosphatase (HAD superfamily)
MALRVAFDLDGVLADLATEVERCRDEIFGDSATAFPSGQSPERRLWQHVETIENFWERLNELEPGAISRLGAIAADSRWEIIFLTTRPATAGATVQVQSQRWLQSKGFPLPSVYVVSGSRGKIAAALDLHAVVDDRLEHCVDVVADSKARPILFLNSELRDRGLQGSADRLGIQTVETMAQCLEILAEMDAAANEDPGILKRVMRKLGLDSDTRGV